MTPAKADHIAHGIPPAGVLSRSGCRGGTGVRQSIICVLWTRNKTPQPSSSPACTIGAVNGWPVAGGTSAAGARKYQRRSFYSRIARPRPLGCAITARGVRLPSAPRATYSACGVYPRSVSTGRQHSTALRARGQESARSFSRSRTVQPTPIRVPRRCAGRRRTPALSIQLHTTTVTELPLAAFSEAASD